MKPITLKIVGYLDLKSLKQFKTKAELIAFKAKEKTNSVAYMAANLLKEFVLSEKIEKSKAKLTTPFRRYCAKVVALRNYSQWLFSLPRAERMAFKFN